MAEIVLTRGFAALIDDADYDEVSRYSWSVRPHEHRFYAQRAIVAPAGRKSTQSLHRFLTGWPLVDHANGDGLDNRRANLRQATPAQNCANSVRRKDNTSGFKGVSFHRGAWVARIQFEHQLRRLGRFATPEEAALAYDAAALDLFGEFARLNFRQEIAS